MERNPSTMRRTIVKLLSTVALVLTLALAPAGAAKGPLHARICGASGCSRTLISGIGFWPSGAHGAVTEPIGSVRFLTVELTSPGSGWLDFHYRYVPSLRLLRVDAGNGNTPYWRRASTEVVRVLAPYVRRLGVKS
jgi:hypothetical protein